MIVVTLTCPAPCVECLLVVGKVLQAKKKTEG
jgi:hypothetical protein